MDAELTFVGTATTLLRLGPFTLLTDPNFVHRGQWVYLGYGLATRRRTEPAMQPEDLPQLDAVLLSHLHADHFDRVAKASLDRSLPIVTTSHAAGKLERAGFSAAVPLEHWSTHELIRGDHRLRVTSTPGTHGPGLLGRLLPPVMGSVVELEHAGAVTTRLWITGDVLFRRELGAVRERWPDLDAMVIHLGGTRVFGFLVTMDGRQGMDLVELIRPGLTVPVHYDDYSVFKSPLSQFLAEARRRGYGGQIRTVHHGETARLSPAGAPR
ncbi:MAG TPA: MBL fold metallo-hydrolase [Acidimicrobiia bacterium]|nr:MBL fold metallo-hydrolase [Acidimicrobiia bacterium]